MMSITGPSDVCEQLIRRVIRPGLCTGCGACVGLDASGKSVMEDTPLGPVPKFALQTRLNPLAFAIEKSDLQRKVRVKRVANLVLFLVDASWSMAVAERMNATKGAILSPISAYSSYISLGSMGSPLNSAWAMVFFSSQAL